MIFWYILIPLSKLWYRKRQPSDGGGFTQVDWEYTLIYRAWCPSEGQPTILGNQGNWAKKVAPSPTLHHY